MEGGYLTSSGSRIIQFRAPPCRSGYMHKGISSNCNGGTGAPMTYTFSIYVPTYHPNQVQFSYVLHDVTSYDSVQKIKEGTTSGWATCGGSFSPTWCEKVVTISGITPGNYYEFTLEKSGEEMIAGGYVSIKGTRIQGIQNYVWEYDATEPGTKGAFFIKRGQ